MPAVRGAWRSVERIKPGEEEYRWAGATLLAELGAILTGYRQGSVKWITIRLEEPQSGQQCRGEGASQGHRERNDEMNGHALQAGKGSSRGFCLAHDVGALG